MTRFETILGHENSLGLLRRMLDEERVPQALLFQGPEGVGKATAARAMVAALLCTASSTTPCGECVSCRMIEHRAHPDLLTIGLLVKPSTSARAAADPSEEDLRKLIVIDQIRQINSICATAPRLAPRRLFIIDPADQMNPSAQNALLKTLEDPPGRSVVILIASRPFLLLPTVRSRCFSVVFAALPTNVLAGMLESRGIAPLEALSRASLSAGCPGYALELDLAALSRRREEILVALEQLSGSRGSLVDLSMHAASLAGKSDASLQEGLSIAETLLRDAARAATSGEEPPLIHIDLAQRLAQLGQCLSPPRAAALLRSFDRLRSDLRFNLNRTLVAESLLAGVAGGPLP